MTNYAINYTPALVPVSDDREEVAGARVTVETVGENNPTTYLVIPSEGPSPDCWLGIKGAAEIEEDLWSEVDAAARAGARGESGHTLVELE